MNRIKERNKRLNRIAKELGREKIWGEDQLVAFLENALDDLEVSKIRLERR